MLYALCFLLGVLIDRVGHIILQIDPMFRFWKLAEFGALKVLAESQVLRYQAIAILQIAYDEANKQEEFVIVKETINKKHDQAQSALINVMCRFLPYETSYKTPQEAYKYVEKLTKQGDLADE